MRRSAEALVDAATGTQAELVAISGTGHGIELVSGRSDDVVLPAVEAFLTTHAPAG